MSEDQLEGGQDIESGELLKWEEVGKKLIGKLIDYRLQSTPKGDGHVYEIKIKDGIIPFFAPSDLHKKLKTITIGDIVSIEYKDKTKTHGGNDFKVFKVTRYPSSNENLKAIGLDQLEGGNDVSDDTADDDPLK